MSLVDYQSSSEEEEEENEAVLKHENAADDSRNVSSISAVKRKQPVKITIPSLQDEDEPEDNEPAKKPKVKGGSGLLSMLPAPKYSSSGRSAMLIPPSVKKRDVENKKPPVSPSKSSAPLSQPGPEVKPPEVEKLGSSFYKPIAKEKTGKDPHAKPDDDDDDDDVLPSDFFSLDYKPDEPVVQEELTPAVPVHGTGAETRISTEPPHRNQSVASVINAGVNDILPKTFSAPQTDYSLPATSSLSHTSQYSYDTSSYGADSAQISCNAPEQYAQPSAETVPTDVLNDERFLRLQGKKQRGLEDVNIVDVCVDAQLPDRTEWHTKSLTEEKKISFSRKKGEIPTQQQRRKHQITYLAFQAKERELDLKNQWSQNRLTRRETQAKYGF